MVHALKAFLDFCYLARRSFHTAATISQMKEAIARYHHFREIFKTSGACAGFELPRQHSIMHYVFLTIMFGAPNGLCSSMTEAKHIKAVKQPWHRSNHHQPLGQMLLTNQRLDKLAAARRDFERCGMLQGDCLSAALTELGFGPDNEV